MEILNNFGFDPILFGAQIVNFLIIFVLLKKYLYKPLLKMLAERKKTISQGIKNAENAEKLMAETILKEEKILKDAQAKTAKMLEDAKKQSEEMIKQAEYETNKKIDTMLKEARAQITYETEIAKKDLEGNISRIAIAFLEKSLKGLFGEKEQETLMKNAIKKLKKAD